MKIVSNYTQSWFLIDVMSSIPFGYIVHISETDIKGSKYNNLGKLLKIPRIYRLLKLAKIVRLFKAFK